MNISEKIKALYDNSKGAPIKVTQRVKCFFIPTPFKKESWISIGEEPDYWFVSLGRQLQPPSQLILPKLAAGFHKGDGRRYPLGGPNKNTGTWRAGASLTSIEDKKEVLRVFDLVSSRIDRAYAVLVAQ